MKLHHLSFIPVLALCASAQAFDLGSLKDKLGNIGGTPAQQATAAAPVAPAAAPAPGNTAAASSALSSFSNNDQVGSLKQALTQGAADCRGESG